MTDLAKTLNQLIEFAHCRYTIYGQIYSCPPAIECLFEFKSLPILHIFDVPKYINYDVLDISQCIGSLPVDLTNFYSTLFPALISEHEYEIAKNYLYSLLGVAGIDCFDEVLLLVEPERAYVAFDLANLLLEFNKLPFIEFVTKQNVSSIKSDIEKTGIKFVVDLSSIHLSVRLSLESVEKVILVNGNPAKSEAGKYATLYYVDKCGYVGLKDQENNQLCYDESKFFIELESNGQIVITCLYRYLLPALRYATFDRGSMVNGRLNVDLFAM